MRLMIRTKIHLCVCNLIPENSNSYSYKKREVFSASSVIGTLRVWVYPLIGTVKNETKIFVPLGQVQIHTEKYKDSF